MSSELPATPPNLRGHEEQADATGTASGQASGSVALFSSPTTPAGNRRRVLLQDQYADAKDPDRKQRRCAISLEVSPRIRSIDYSDLCEDIGLAEQLQLYESAVGTLFDDLSKQMPVIGKDGLNYSPNIRDTAISNNLCDSIGKSVGKKERALTDHFAWLWEHMRMLSKPDVPGVKQQSPYSLIDYQTKMAPGTRLQPDGLFVHKDITQETFATAHMILEAKWATCENGLDDEDLGQIGDYVLRIWTEQYTRIFVPVLLLHGGNVSLMVFTRQGVCVAELGPICVRQVKSQVIGSAKIAKTLQRIWFILTLSTSSFGHICNVTNNKQRLQFVTGSDVTRMVRTADYNANNMVRLDERIDRPVKIFRRTSYMYRSKFADRPVILKLTWTPTYCYPEGAGYMMISEACNGYIPEVYLSGVLVKNSFGYRLEFLVLEDCGIPIDTYAIRCRNVGTKAEQFSATLAKSIKHVSECLAKAYAAGVLHRDISAGNIAIKGGQARLIDWGYSRARSDIDIPNLDEIERLFAFDNEAASMEERQHDSLTGTNLFMSVQMLMGSTERSLIHDLESLFFVGLYTLAKFQGSIGPKCDKLPLGFRRVGNEETAAIRVGCLSTKNLYLENFGIRDCPDVIAQVFDSMYQTLFMHNGRYIGGQMLADSNYAREIDLDMASKFMDTQILLTKSCSDLEMSGSQLLDESMLPANIQTACNMDTSSYAETTSIVETTRIVETTSIVETTRIVKTASIVETPSNTKTPRGKKKRATRMSFKTRAEYANFLRNQASSDSGKENTDASSAQSPAKRTASTSTPRGAGKKPASRRRFN